MASIPVPANAVDGLTNLSTKSEPLMEIRKPNRVSLTPMEWAHLTRKKKIHPSVEEIDEIFARQHAGPEEGDGRNETSREIAGVL